MREGTRILNFMTKLDVNLDQDTVYRLLASPQWTSQDSLLPTDPQFIADTHQTLADGLFFPCPEPPPDPRADDAEDEDDDDAGDEDVTKMEIGTRMTCRQSWPKLRARNSNSETPLSKPRPRPWPCSRSFFPT